MFFFWSGVVWDDPCIAQKLFWADLVSFRAVFGWFIGDILGVTERGTLKGVMKLLGRDVMGGWSRTEFFFPDGPRAVTHPACDPPEACPRPARGLPATHPWISDQKSRFHFKNLDF